MVIFLAKPIEYVVELNKEEAKLFLEDMLNPKPNPARKKFLEEVKKTKFRFK